MINYLLYLLFRGFILVVNVLPSSLRYYLGIGFGYFVYILTKSRRKVTIKNLQQAFGDKYSEQTILEMVKDIYFNLGLLIVEFALLKQINQKNFKEFIAIEGEEYLKEAYNKNQGVIIYSAHFGNWEWLASFISLMGYPLIAIAQVQKNSYFNQLVNKIRESKGVHIAAKGIAVRKAYRHLKKGRCVFILGDQDAGDHGWKTNFFGRPASTYSGAVKLAQKTGARIVPAFLIRSKGDKHKLIFHSPYKIEQDASLAEQKELLQELTDVTESVIRENVTQWLWLHRRWKTH